MYRQSFVYACDVNGSDHSVERIIIPPLFMTQKSLQSYLYPTDPIPHLVCVGSYKGANKQMQLAAFYQ